MGLPVRQLRLTPSGAVEAYAAAKPEASRGLRLVSLSEVLTALSYALDLTGGLPPGHTVRTCMIGMRIAHTLGLSDEECAALYDAVLMKDAGSTSNSSYVKAIFGGEYGLNKLKLARARSERSSRVALKLGFPRATAHAIRSLDEQWDGSGFPDGKRGSEIPLLSRIASLAQTIEVCRSQRGVTYAFEVARSRRGRSFEPRLVDIVSTWENDSDWWTRLESPDITAEVLALKPCNHVRLVDERGVDDVARAFADIIDAKSPFTYQHSTRVSEYACGIAERAGLPEEEIRRLRRAAWLHDIGKLGISSHLLDKAGPLTSAERIEMKRHPLHTWEILSRVSAFADFARMAAHHHEKLDGSGYPWGVKADELDTATRILCVADVFEALTSARPYRAGLAPSVAMSLIQRDAGVRLCPTAVEGLLSLVEALPNQMVS
jgi:HD-GYP domain-containing protein (c-di-GMP phosphodiesterase class II)